MRRNEDIFKIILTIGVLVFGLGTVFFISLNYELHSQVQNLSEQLNATNVTAIAQYYFNFGMGYGRELQNNETAKGLQQLAEHNQSFTFYANDSRIFIFTPKEVFVKLETRQ